MWTRKICFVFCCSSVNADYNSSHWEEYFVVFRQSRRENWSKCIKNGHLMPFRCIDEMANVCSRSINRYPSTVDFNKCTWFDVTIPFSIEFRPIAIRSCRCCSVSTFVPSTKWMNWRIATMFFVLCTMLLCLVGIFPHVIHWQVEINFAMARVRGNYHCLSCWNGGKNAIRDGIPSFFPIFPRSYGINAWSRFSHCPYEIAWRVVHLWKWWKYSVFEGFEKGLSLGYVLSSLLKGDFVEIPRTLLT